MVAPAAGLHFSRELMRRMEIYDIDRDFITMHVSLGYLYARRCYRDLEFLGI